jgi:hypothetical protein
MARLALAKCRNKYFIRASPRVYQILLGKSFVLPTFKNICKVKKEFISNNLAYFTF